MHHASPAGIKAQTIQYFVFCICSAWNPLYKRELTYSFVLLFRFCMRLFPIFAFFPTCHTYSRGNTVVTCILECMIVFQILMLRKPITQGSGGTADSELDAKCAQRVARYIQSNSTMKGQQELALQAYQQIIQEKIRVGEKVREAHGV